MSSRAREPELHSDTSSESRIELAGTNMLRLEKTTTLPPVDVGFIPWLQVIGGFFILFNTWGIVVAFGTFQSYYETSTTIKGSASSIAWIGSLQAFLLLFGSAFTGRLFDAGYLRHLLVIGSFLIVFGLMMTSLVNTYYQALLAQGICVGLGMGCLLVPGVGVPSTWFAKHRSLAVGIVTCGSAIGGVILPIMLQRMIVEVGFPWAVRTLGFIALATLSISIVVMKQRLPPRKRGSFIEVKALREPEFALYASGMLITLLGFYVFYNFIEAWAVEAKVNTHGLSPIYLLPIMNAGSAFGRVLPNLLADQIGPLNVQVPCTLIAGILVYSWLGIQTLPALLIVAILYGFFSGALISLPPSAVASMTKDMSTFGARMGLVFVFMGIGSLIGTPITGALVQGTSDGQGYDAARIWSGTTIVAGTTLMAASRFWISHVKGNLLAKI